MPVTPALGRWKKEEFKAILNYTVILGGPTWAMGEKDKKYKEVKETNKTPKGLKEKERSKCRKLLF